MSCPSPAGSDDASWPSARASTSTSAAGPSGLVWTPQGPMLRFDNAVVEEVVTRVRRTTTSFAPIPLPRIPASDHIPMPHHLSAQDGYPLAHEPMPEDMRYFTFDMEGRKVIVQDDSVDSSSGVEGHTFGPGWTRAMDGDDRGLDVDSFFGRKGKGKGKERESNKRPHELTRPATFGYNTPSYGSQSQGEASFSLPRPQSPPRKKIRPSEAKEEMEDVVQPHSPVSVGSPKITDSDTSLIPSQPSIGNGLEMAALFSLPAIVEHFDKLPDKIQQHVLMHMCRRARMPTIQRIAGFTSAALRRDFISQLPDEVALEILAKCDLQSLIAGTRVNKRWQRLIDNEKSVWRDRLKYDGLEIGHGIEEAEERSIKARWGVLDWKHDCRAQKAGTPTEDEHRLEELPHFQDPEDRPTPLKHIYRRRYTNNRNWLERKPTHTTFPGHGISVVTCVQFDDEKIVSASDDHSINIYNTQTGVLKRRLDGHEGGIWALEYKGDTLVSGSTDRTIRIWDLEKLRPTHVFHGHTSTVRCLQIVEPVYYPDIGEFQPPYPMVVTGSRDATLRVWKIPKKGESAAMDGEGDDAAAVVIQPEANPYHVHHLEGHSEAVRALAVHGRTCVSGSYDRTVRVWDIVKGTCTHVLYGHELKVYSIAIDPIRNRCASGSMDNTVRVWDLEAGTCLHTLPGHTSLVGLLSISPNYLASAAADGSVRIWDAETCELLHSLMGHAAAITCFLHDETKVLTGSDGTLRLWDIRTGKYVRDLIIGISSVWQVACNGHKLVAASNRHGNTVFDVFDFGSSPDRHGVDDVRLDDYIRKPWEREDPREPQSYQDDAAKLAAARAAESEERGRSTRDLPSSPAGGRKTKSKRPARNTRAMRAQPRSLSASDQASVAGSPILLNAPGSTSAAGPSTAVPTTPDPRRSIFGGFMQKRGRGRAATEGTPAAPSGSRRVGENEEAEVVDEDNDMEVEE